VLCWIWNVGMRKGCQVPGSGYLAYPASCIPGVRVFRRQVPGTEYRIRWPAFGPRPGQRRREGRTSLAPHPSMAEGRIPRTEPGDRLSGTWDPVPEPVRHRGPNTERRGPSPATGKRAHRVCTMQDRNVRIRITWYPEPGTWHPCPIPTFQILTWMQDTGCTMQDRKGSDPGYLVPGTWYLAPSPHFKS